MDLGFNEFFLKTERLDQAICFNDGDVVLVPKGHHPCGYLMATNFIILMLWLVLLENGDLKIIQILNGYIKEIKIVFKLFVISNL